MVALIIFPVILQTVINVIMLSIGRQGSKRKCYLYLSCNESRQIWPSPLLS